MSAMDEESAEVPGGVPSVMFDVSGDRARADADFIAAARADVPALVAEVRRLREEIRSLQTHERDL